MVLMAAFPADCVGKSLHRFFSSFFLTLKRAFGALQHTKLRNRDLRWRNHPRLGKMQYTSRQTVASLYQCWDLSHSCAAPNLWSHTRFSSPVTTQNTNKIQAVIMCLAGRWKHADAVNQGSTVCYCQRSIRHTGDAFCSRPGEQPRKKQLHILQAMSLCPEQGSIPVTPKKGPSLLSPIQTWAACIRARQCCEIPEKQAWVF